jgi:ABC-type Fe3+ transport system permease subunit
MKQDRWGSAAGRCYWLVIGLCCILYVSNILLSSYAWGGERDISRIAALPGTTMTMRLTLTVTVTVAVAVVMVACAEAASRLHALRAGSIYPLGYARLNGGPSLG